MAIIQELAFTIGEKGGIANRKVAEKCIANPALISELVEGFSQKNLTLVGDCCEVFTEIAKKNPELVVPYAYMLPAFLIHKNGRIQWESMHCLALTAHLIPEIVKPLLDKLMTIIETSKGVIVRNYAVETIANYVHSSQEAAQIAFPLLKRSLVAWEERHAAQVLLGFTAILATNPEYKEEICSLVSPFTEKGTAAVRKLSKSIMKCQCD